MQKQSNILCLAQQGSFELNPTDSLNQEDLAECYFNRLTFLGWFYTAFNYSRFVCSDIQF